MGERSERPILFSGEMVRAILAGRKTQTRRVITSANSYVDGYRCPSLFRCLDFASPQIFVDAGPSPAGNPGPYIHVPKLSGETSHRVYPLLWPGDHLWVRETWRLGGGNDEAHNADDVHYRADPDECAGGPWRPSIFLPRWGSRLTLEITTIKVQRVQSIDEHDAIAEGVNPAPFCKSGRPEGLEHVEAFEALWDHINAKRGFGWQANPWVWVIAFRVLWRQERQGR